MPLPVTSFLRPARPALLWLGAGLVLAGLAVPVRAQLGPGVDGGRHYAPRRGLPVYGWLRAGRASAEPDLVFFPPAPPPLGSAPDGPEAGGLRVAPPAELAPFLAEPFYAPLSAHLASPDPDAWLSSRQKQELAAFRDAKAALQAELLARLYTLRESEPAARRRELEAFAREQTPRLQELERTAEHLRGEFAAGDDARAEPGFEPGLPGAAPAADRSAAARLRRAAFYEPALAPEQRRLVRELVLELAEDAAGRGGAAGRWILFSPDTTRVPLPEPLQQELAAKVADYLALKGALKRELRSALVHPLRPPGSPAEDLAALAAQQAPRFQQLERLAEEIRDGLQPLVPDPLRVPRLPALPPGLEERIAAYRRAKLELQKALLARVQEAAGRAPAGDSAAQQARVQQTIDAFTRDHAARYAALDAAKESIRRDLAGLKGAGAAGGGDDRSADRLLRNFTDSFQQYELWRLYYEYRIAVFEPGLSPEQRRLLLGVALERLAPPPPGPLLPAR